MAKQVAAEKIEKEDRSKLKQEFIGRKLTVLNHKDGVLFEKLANRVVQLNG